MSAKPSTLPRWADVGGAIVEPPAGTKDTGHTAGSQPLHSFENWYKNLVYLWTQYLSDGALSGNHTITGTLTTSQALTVQAGGVQVTGNSVNTGTYRVNGTTTAAGQLTVGGTASFAPFTFTADASTNQGTATAHGMTNGVGPVQVTTTGTQPAPLALVTNYWLIVDGANTFKFALTQADALNGVFIDLTTAGSGTHTINAQGGTRIPQTVDHNGSNITSGNLSVGGTLSVTGGFTAGANSHVTVSGTGEYKHGDVEMTLSPTTGGAPTGWGTTSAGNSGPRMICNTVGTNLGIAIPLKKGDRLKSVSVQVAGNSSADAIIKCYVLPNNMGTATQIGTVTVTNAPPTFANTAIGTFTTTTLTTGQLIYVDVDPQSVSGIIIGTITYVYDHP